MDKNLIKNVVTGIEFTEESKQRIFDGFDGIERKKTLKEKIYMKRITTGIVVTAMIFMCFFMNIIVIRQIKRCRFHQIKTGLSEHLTMG